jgi:hypothetical protein
MSLLPPDLCGRVCAAGFAQPALCAVAGIGARTREVGRAGARLRSRSLAATAALGGYNGVAARVVGR